MADGYARALNDPSVAGVCIAQNGPGITNFVTGNLLCSTSGLELGGGFKSPYYLFISSNCTSILIQELPLLIGLIPQ